MSRACEGGHTPVLHPDTELVEFSPTAELNQTMKVVMKNMDISEVGTRPTATAQPPAAEPDRTRRNANPEGG